MRKLVLALAFLSFGASALADQVVLKNGDRLTGTIVKSDAKSLTLKSEFAGTVTIASGEAAPGRVQLSVTDTGPGVRPEIAKRIFEPFFTTKPEGQGTGLGLSICYQIAEEHGGSIRVDTSGERGACFVLELPAAARGALGTAA